MQEGYAEYYSAELPQKGIARAVGERLERLRQRRQHVDGFLCK